MPVRYEVMTRCPETGEPVSTGRTVDIPVFDYDEDFIGRYSCSSCHGNHSWSDADRDVRIVKSATQD
jgi:hypothetical protein